MSRIVIIGGGIVGLATAKALSETLPDVPLTVLEAEDRVGVHQSGHNSNVIHSGLYYPPGSLKARLARQGGELMIRYCEEHGLPVDRRGKLVVATATSQLVPMAELARRGRANGVTLREIGEEEVRELEPDVAGIAALDIADTAITDFAAVTRSYAAELAARGVDLRLGARVAAVDRPGARDGGPVVVRTERGEELEATVLVNCAGLFSDRVARMCGVDPGVRVQPFRGEYSALAQRAGTTVHRPVYPVPDPELPFLGVHLTPGVDGTVHVGPNAVPAFSRTGYRWRDLDASTISAWWRDPGMRRLARSYWRDGAREVVRSLSKPMLVADVRRLLPQVRSHDLRRAGAGVRAQAVDDAGRLVDDFVVRATPGAVHVLNAPSPAATSSLLIGRYVAGLAREAYDGTPAPDVAAVVSG
ncbi:L-2-hydroxyglutarate oxidase [Nocardioides sp. DS6]|uniref:L-2-hydroxyglutarate oxidase n=1 Tax=Nocardioides eburneus TaxID=3231482 RepID=A0ABV3STA7_9ACTN